MKTKRYDFTRHILEEKNADKNPFRQFEKWYKEAQRAEGENASAMTVATVSPGGQPTQRTIFLRGLDKKGFCFYTNYNSRKGKDLSGNKHICLLFFWKDSQRQIIIEGKAEKLSAKESDRYFAGRPRGSQIGAWASQQSQSIVSRTVLEEWVKEFTRMFEGKKIPRPAHWGGYRVIPARMEFWQGRESRLHDRIVYTQKNGKWKIARLSP